MSTITPNWERFAFDIRYDPVPLRDDLVRIEAYRLSLQRLILPQEWQADLQKLFITRSVHGTAAIEGNPLTEEQVARQLHDTPATQPRDQLHRQTRNAYTAFQWVEKEFATFRPLTTEDICKVQQLLTKGSDERDNTPGRMRESGHNVTVGSPTLGGVHRPPPGGPVLRRLTERFVEFINSARFRNEPVVVQALVAHLYFVTLHPFGDGNGRTTRCIEAAILVGNGYNTYGLYSLANFFYRNRDDYFRFLQETHTKHRYDLTEFLRFGVRGFREELDRINAYVLNRTHRLHYRELVRRCLTKKVGARRRLLNPREADLLHAILDRTKPADPFSEEGGREVSWDELTVLAIQLYRGRTMRTILRELFRLKDLGFLQINEDEDLEDWRVSIDFRAIAKHG